ncbi:MAG: ArsR family transcriptional regulator [Arcobacter sp.]|nr:ArsR family transcriptional regulator [Arcobacter sp.]
MFNSILHNPIRSKIVSLLSCSDELSFKELKLKLELSDGNLNGHIKALNKEEYLEVNKFFDNNKPKTVYKLSEKGKKAFVDYLDELKKFLNDNEIIH